MGSGGTRNIVTAALWYSFRRWPGPARPDPAPALWYSTASGVSTTSAPSLGNSDVSTLHPLFLEEWDKDPASPIGGDPLLPHLSTLEDILFEGWELGLELICSFVLPAPSTPCAAWSNDILACLTFGNTVCTSLLCDTTKKLAEQDVDPPLACCDECTKDHERMPEPEA